MSMDRGQTSKLIAGFAVVAALAIAFWMLLLQPKRQEASEKSQTVSTLREELGAERARVAEGVKAKGEFPRAYRELVVLGKAVPKSDETASLLIQLNRLAHGAHTEFEAIALASGSGSGGSSAPASSSETEDAASRLPFGASVGAAGLPAMPYELGFNGGFFDVANFIHGVDSQVQTVKGKVDAKGRLITIDGFTLKPIDGDLSSELEADFKVTTYVAPPGQGLTGGATAAGPEGSAP